MATSKYSNKSGEWEASASVFSGRPDPRWNPGQAAVKSLERLWTSLPPCAVPCPAPPPLGYRGCSLRDPVGGRWFAFGGVVIRDGPKGAESRRDEDRAFERMILGSAPEGLIPAPFLAVGGGSEPL
jgi:hypothetical protein